MVIQAQGPSELGGRGTIAPPLYIEMGFMWTFSKNQDAIVKLKSKLISINFSSFLIPLPTPS